MILFLGLLVAATPELVAVLAHSWWPFLALPVAILCALAILSVKP